jgi:pyridoxal phosphate enzyme (YggS family)
MAAAMATTLSERVAAVEARVAAACARAGRARSEVRLVGVTKGKDPSVIRAAVDEGLTTFGENYVQEWTAKRSALAGVAGLEWHFIGRVQRNKASAVAEASLVHSLADLRVATALAAVGVRRGAPVRVLIQINLDDEASKSGVAPAALPDVLGNLEDLAGLQVEGLMAIPAPGEPESMRPRFRGLRLLRDRQTDAARLTELSMGMSDDFEVAIEEGATLIRVGTALFGPRERDA